MWKDVSTIGYCATAGIAVFIIVFHYFFSYEPRLDPFRNKQDDPILCVRPRPNPIDEILLRRPRELFYKAFGTTRKGRKNHVRLENSLVKCILAMSDIQIITGISIIVSGAAQLKCGISTYQWQVLVYLAWFSSLTHLSCLTLLRNYLHQRPAERIWRLICIFVLIVLLILALLPTANYRWQYGYPATPTGRPAPQDYAICYLKPGQGRDTIPNAGFASIDYGQSRPGSPSYGHTLSGNSTMAMCISVVLMSVGFICRVLKLHQCLSNLLTRSIRDRSSHMLRKPLRTIEGWCVTPSFLHSMQRLLLYRPLLALFLTLRILVDTWDSMFFEVCSSRIKINQSLLKMQVWWLMVSFSWGVQRLFGVVALFPDKENMEWTFGQVMAIKLLAVPLVSALEFFYPEPKGQEVEENQDRLPSISVGSSNNSSEIPTYSEPAVSDSQDFTPRPFNDHPDYKLYYESGSLTTATMTLILSIVSLSFWCLVLAYKHKDLKELGFLQLSFYPWGLPPLVFMFCIFYGVLFSFLIATIGSEKRRKDEIPSLLVRSLPLVVILCLTAACFIMSAFGTLHSTGWAAFCVAGLYLLCSLFSSVCAWYTRGKLPEV
ncbi:unnamed protein product [Penicillium salamii]|nr:unnamed protein product [Penicillium salamii]CAG8402370.1 unnamed protein product [Penicillium salamii]